MQTEKMKKLSEIVAKMEPEARRRFLLKVGVNLSKTASPSSEKKLTPTKQGDSTIKGSGEPLYFAKLPSGCLCGGPVTPYFPSTVNTPAEREAYLALDYTLGDGG